MRIALCQMNVSTVKKDNLLHARQLIDEAARGGAELVMLPEMFCCEYRNRAFVENREPRGGPVWTMLAEAAAANGVYLAGGTMPELDGERTYNTCFVFDRQGREIARHRKMHLFDINIEGGQCFQESKTFTGGDEVTVFDTELGRLGLMICFDVRFPELPRLMALSGAKLILCPAAFNMTTGPAHWELLHRSRALDNQVFIAACSPARSEGGSYVSFAHSMVTDPWGRVAAEAGTEETILYHDIDLSMVESIRQQLPLLSSRREDVYELKLK